MKFVILIKHGFIICFKIYNFVFQESRQKMQTDLMETRSFQFKIKVENSPCFCANCDR